jgi:hypothetical protein
LSVLNSPLISALAAVLTCIVGALVVILVGRRSRRFQTIESSARAELSFDVELKSRVLVAPDSGNTQFRAVLETRVDVRNNSRISGCIPAIYVSGRVLVKSGSSKTIDAITDFAELDECVPLSLVKNVAKLSNSIYQLAPDEVETFVRWDGLTESFVAANPVIVMNVELFGVVAEPVGEIRYPKYRKGKLRDAWIQYMNEAGGIRHNTIIFERWQPNKGIDHVGFYPGSRYLLSMIDPSEADVENTRRFKELLTTMTQWTRHITVDLRLPFEDAKVRFEKHG